MYFFVKWFKFELHSKEEHFQHFMDSFPKHSFTLHSSRILGAKCLAYSHLIMQHAW